MFMFCGDSHSRIFQIDTWGKFSFTSFSGATIAGLPSPRSHTQHGAIIRHLARAPETKTLVLMFGNVDIDFTFYRSSALDPDVTLERFIADRVRNYISFLTLLCDDDFPDSVIEDICVLGAHPTPVLDENFIDVTGPQTKLERSAFEELGKRMDLSQVARTKRGLALNDALEQELPRFDNRISFHRIDKAMLAETGVIDNKYAGQFRLDHHPNRNLSRQLWYKALADKIPAFKERARS
ncbi:hypothetical protein [Roseivivax sediminis]|uniref:Uncharacterized protein n=1 Tax=Roseivivax sediminis TaxID=936889 RepID=A0A1I2CUC3_9RHOB|nr:hypothetical protein [Roseivivax sediminis]SFE71782.1 hypothetical protein SAMN04515678_11484 [Roseivivax sediminis]